MKKLLNNSIFYQGDNNIFLPLLSTYIVAYFGIKICFSNFITTLYYNLYTNVDKIWLYFPYESLMVLGSVAFLTINFVIISGFFKRKKWTTLLSGPFSRSDIRKREAILMGLAIMVFITLFLVVSLENYIINRDVITYFGSYLEMILLDFVRMTFILVAFTAYLFFIDSFFSNIFGTLIGGIMPIIFLFSGVKYIDFLSNYQSSFYNGLDYILGKIMQYTVNTNWTYFDIKIYCLFIIFFLLLAFVFGFFAIRLIKGIKIENFKGIGIYKKVNNRLILLGALAISIWTSPGITNTLLFNIGLVPYEVGFVPKFSISLIVIIALVYILIKLTKAIKLGFKKTNII